MSHYQYLFIAFKLLPCLFSLNLLLQPFLKQLYSLVMFPECLNLFPVQLNYPLDAHVVMMLSLHALSDQVFGFLFVSQNLEVPQVYVWLPVIFELGKVKLQTELFGQLFCKFLEVSVVKN